MKRAAPLATESASPGGRLREARRARGWSKETLARRIVAVRTARGEAADPVSVKTQISRWENDRITPDRLSLGIIADALDSGVEAIFGLPVDPSLPRPVLVEAHVTALTIDLLRAQRDVHVQTEHSWGPAVAGALVASDLATVQGLLAVAPEALSGQMHAVAALIAELGGWIAQDSGHQDDALALTCLAHSYAQGRDDPEIEAVVLMRWANIVTPGDPRLGSELAHQAAQVAGGMGASRLHAAIARQEANAAAALGDHESL